MTTIDKEHLQHREKMRRTIRLFIVAAIASICVVANMGAQKTPAEQRMSREQLAMTQARHICRELAFDDKTAERFTDTYIMCQKEVWALGPRRNNGENESDALTEQAIKQRFAMSEKILNIRQKYYKVYSEFLTQRQIQRVYEIERQMMKQLAKHRGENRTRQRR